MREHFCGRLSAEADVIAEYGICADSNRLGSNSLKEQQPIVALANYWLGHGHASETNSLQLALVFRGVGL